MKMGHIVWLLTMAAALTGSLFQQLHAIEVAASAHQSDVRLYTQTGMFSYPHMNISSLESASDTVFRYKWQQNKPL